MNSFKNKIITLFDKILGKVKCKFMNTHIIDDDEWTDSYGWGEFYLGQTNLCKRCGEIINRD